MKRLATIMISAAMLATLSAPAQTSQKISLSKANDYGLIYNLPSTALDIYIEAELTEEHPGEFYNYARKHLGIGNAVISDRRNARVLSATIVPRGVANNAERWVAQFKPGQTASMLLDGNNIPLAINDDSGVENAGPAIPAPRAADPSPLEGPAARQAVTQDMARSASVSKKAELAAQRIFELRETRNDILSGQAENPPADGNAMKLVLDNLAAQEAALTAMFAGTVSKSTVVERYTLLPDSTDIKGRVLARLSAVDGLIDADNLAGAPVSIDLKVLEQGKLPVNEKGETKTFPKGGVAYCIPGRALLTVYYDGERVASEEVSLAQLGVVFGLNPSLFTDKKAPYRAVFSPVNGALLDLSPVSAE